MEILSTHLPMHVMWAFLLLTRTNSFLVNGAPARARVQSIKATQKVLDDLPNHFFLYEPCDHSSPKLAEQTLISTVPLLHVQSIKATQKVLDDLPNHEIVSCLWVP